MFNTHKFIMTRWRDKEFQFSRRKKKLFVKLLIKFFDFFLCNFTSQKNLKLTKKSLAKIAFYIFMNCLMRKQENHFLDWFCVGVGVGSFSTSHSNYNDLKWNINKTAKHHSLINKRQTKITFHKHKNVKVEKQTIFLKVQPREWKIRWGRKC